MFEAQMDDLSLLRESMSAIAELIDETALLIRRDGIKMIAADRAVVAVVDFFLSKDAFKEYNYTSDMRIGLNLINLLRILRRSGPNDTAKIRISDNRFEIKLMGDSLRSFVLPIIDVTEEEIPPIDKLKFPVSLDMRSDILSNGIEDADLIADSIVFSIREDRFLMMAEGDSSSVELELTKDALNNLIAPEASRSRYSLDYLKKIIKAKRLSDSVKIALATDYPMKMVFDVPGKMHLSFILAPRVEE